MATYNGRRAPNMVAYLADLNTIPSTHEVPVDTTIGDADLDFLTNAEFFDFDSFNPNVDFNAPSPRGEKSQRVPVNGQQFQFGEFQTYPNPSAGLHAQYPPQPNHQLAYGSPQVGEKRKGSATNTFSSPVELQEDTYRSAVEEDKRRRNTAASARFRVKKKQREQALEKQTKEMTDKVQALEGRVQQLEMENKWLKGLITDKNDGKTLEMLQQGKESEDRKADDKTDGVGTIDADEENVDVDEEEI